MTPRRDGTGPHSRARSGFPRPESTFVVACEIVELARLTPQHRLQAHQTLLLAARSSDLLAGPRARDRVFQPTGDGFTLYVGSSESVLRPTDVVAFLGQLRHFCVNQNSQWRRLDLSFRAGIHVSDVTFLAMDSESGPLAVGVGAQIAHRICGIGDSYHILCSNAFSAALAGQEQSGLRLPSVSSCGQRVISEAEVLHIFNLHLEPDVGNPRLPSTFQRDRKVEHAALSHLRDLHDVFVAYFRHHAGLSAEKLGCRLTVLIPDEARRHLRVSGLRVDPITNRITPSQAAFAITPGEERELSALAYREGKPRFALGLPDRETDRNAFLDMMNSLGCRLTPNDIALWRRMSRAYVSIPIELSIDERRVVLSADFLSPLKGVTNHSIEEFCVALREYPAYLPMLAVLLQSKSHWQ